MNNEFMTICEEVRQIGGKHRTILPAKDARAAMETDIRAFLEKCGQNGLLVYGSTVSHRTNDYPIFIEFSVGFAHLPNVFHDAMLQVTGTRSYIYLFALDFNGDNVLGLQNLNAPPVPSAPIDPNDAWNRAMKGM